MPRLVVLERHVDEALQRVFDEQACNIASMGEHDARVLAVNNDRHILAGEVCKLRSEIALLRKYSPLNMDEQRRPIISGWAVLILALAVAAMLAVWKPIYDWRVG